MKTLPVLQPARSREAFVELLHQLQRDLQAHPEGWENATLPSFLGAMAGWVEDMEGYHANLGEPLPEKIPWKLFSDFLLAARTYE